MPVPEGHRGVRRNDVRVVALELHAVPCFDHRHRRRACEELGQQAFVGGIEVLHQHVRQPGFRGKAADEASECLEATGGRANADDRWPADYRGRGVRMRDGPARGLGRAFGHCRRALSIGHRSPEHNRKVDSVPHRAHAQGRPGTRAGACDVLPRESNGMATVQRGAARRPARCRGSSRGAGETRQPASRVVTVRYCGSEPRVAPARSHASWQGSA